MDSAHSKDSVLILFQDGEQRVHVEILPVEVLDTEDALSPPLLNSRTPADTTPAQDFLSGKKCLTGVIISLAALISCFMHEVTKSECGTKSFSY